MKRVMDGGHTVPLEKILSLPRDSQHGQKNLSRLELWRKHKYRSDGVFEHSRSKIDCFATLAMTKQSILWITLFLIKSE